MAEASTLSLGWSVCHPSPGWQYCLPEEIARARQAVVLALERDRVWIAVPDPQEPGLREALTAATRRPVQLVAASPAELALGLARCGRGGDARQLRQARLLHLVDELGLGFLLDPTDRVRLEQPPLRGEDVTAAVAERLPQGWGRELLGLVDGFPHVQAETVHFLSPMRLLLPPALRDSDHPTVFPWRVIGDVLVLGCATQPNEATLDAIAAWTGLEVRCALADASAVRQAGSGYARGDIESAGDENRWKMLDPGRLFRSDPKPDRYLQAVARQTGSSLQEVEERFGGRSVKEPAVTALPEPDPAAAALLPAALVRSLGVLPLALRDGRIELGTALDQSAAEEVASLVSIITGHPVRLRRAGPPALRQAIIRAYGAGDPQRSPHLSPDSRPRIPEGEIDPGRDLWAAMNGLPSIRLERYAALPPGVTPLSLEQMDELRALPLLREGKVLWIAAAEPSVALRDELVDLTDLSIRLVLAAPEAIDDHLAALDHYGSSRSPDQRQRHPVLTYLESEYGLTKADAARALSDMDLGVDEALDTAGILPFSEFAEVAGRLAGVEPVDLQLQSVEEEIIDGLGQPGHRQVWVDPVDATLVRLVEVRTERSAAILPFARRNGRLLVAVADPFEPAVAAMLSALEDESPLLCVAPRPAIMTGLARASGEMPLGEWLIANGIVSPPDLARALHLHRSSGVRLGQALLNLNLVSDEQLAYFLADQRGLPFFRLMGVEPDPEVGRLIPEEIARQDGILPLYETASGMVVATSDPLNQRALDEVAARLGRPVDPVVVTESDLQGMLEELYRGEYLQRSTSELVARTPEESASRVLTRQQIVFFAGTVVLLLALLPFYGMEVAIGVTAIFSLFYVVFSLYKCYLIYRALSHQLEVPISGEEVAALDDAALPIYTILVPLYREASVLPTLLTGLTRLNYPSTKLDVKLLLEEDDDETRAAVEARALPAYVEPVIVPAAHPRNKPKACNYGLIHARGEYVVIYDAEDVPDPDQIKKAIVAFQKSPEDVVCVQAKLNYYNSEQNLLTRWFTTEYSMWFDLMLPGLDAAGVPIPLGGTSNHFPIARLREVGAWDPYNVTEDADLGLRLYRRGGKTAIIDSTTLEEANSEVYNWIRQRSRWVKGYIQTYLVHMRHPFKLWRSLGTRAFFGFQMMIGGTFFGFLINPLFWMLTALWYLAHAGFIRTLYPTPVYYMGLFSLAIGNFAFIYLNVAGCLRRGHYAMVKYALLSPLYWSLMSVAAWKGFLQLAYKPFYWEKTVHGLYTVPGAEERQGSET